MCGAALSGLSSCGQAPDSTFAISARIAIIASQKRSSSASDSLSVGSTISVPGDRKAQRRRVKAVVDEALGDVLGADALSTFVAAGRLLERAQVEDALVGNATAPDAGDVAAVVQLVRPGEPCGDVVGIEDRRLGRGAQARFAHHADVHPADRQHAGVAERCRRDRADRPSLCHRPPLAWPGRNGTSRRPRRPARPRGRRRRAGCRRSCAG